MSGCNFIIEPDRVQCSQDDDCANRGPEFSGSVCVQSMCQFVEPEDPLWGCLDGPPPEAPGPGPFTVNFHTQDIFRQDPETNIAIPIADMDVKVCRKLDTDCEDPEAVGLKTDANGDLSVQVAGNFNGYVIFEKEEHTTGVYYFNPGVASDVNVSVQIGTPGIVAGLTGIVGSEQLEDRGLILLNVLDCQGAAGGGITYKADGTDDLSRTFYVVDGLPTASVNATDATGYGGLVNVLPGARTVHGEIEATGRRIDTISVRVRANAITYSRLVALGQP